MTRVEVTGVLNAQFDCTRCRASRSWTAAARSDVRQYSSIHRLRCASCGEQVVAKAVGGRYSSDYARVHARKEYEALCALQSAFPQDAQYGTVVPLGHLEHAGQGIVITRFIPGDDLIHYIRKLDATGVQAVCGAAGAWLSKLHGCDVQTRGTGVGAADKISYLADMYGAVLRSDPNTQSAYALFAREASDVDAMILSAVRLHGDFKPDNMLCDGTRYMGLDIRWRSMGAAVYDLAPFLNHLWLDLGGLSGLRTRRFYELGEEAFLSGYGAGGETRALRWAQLYFALCYMGDYRKRGRLTGSYANWKVRPLVRRLAVQLERVS